MSKTQQGRKKGSGRFTAPFSFYTTADMAEEIRQAALIRCCSESQVIRDILGESFRVAKSASTHAG
jgi:hypothetical protein